MNKYFKHIQIKASRRLLRYMDSIIDYFICGQRLVNYIPSIFRDDAHGVGGTGSESTHYIILKRIFAHVSLTKEDSFMDIGCGMGRVLAFLVRRHVPCSLSGIEHNPISGQVAQNWSKKYNQITVTLGDAFQMDYNPYSVLFMNRPFLPITFLEFIEKLETTLTHPVTLIYWVDQQSGYLLRNRPGWEMHFRDTLFSIHGLLIAPSPQSYSIWTFDPGKRKSIGDEVHTGICP